MQISLGDQITTSDGHNVGHVEWLILDPATSQLKAMVVRKGFILSDDVEISHDDLAIDLHGQVRLKYRADQLKELPRFDESRYTAPPADVLSAWGYPPSAGLLWPAFPPTGPLFDNSATTNRELQDSRRQEDLDNAVIVEGSDVISRDGEKVGEVHSISFDVATGRPTRLVVSRGFIFTKEIELPGDAIASVDDEAVYLNLTQEEIRRR